MRYDPKRKLIYCPSCQKAYSTDNIEPGRKIICLKCDKVLNIPLHFKGERKPLIYADDPKIIDQFPRYMIRCPDCGNPYDVTNLGTTKRVKCVRCLASLLIPDMDSDKKRV